MKDFDKITDRVARRVAGASGFTILRPLKLKSEGSTRISLENARTIRDAGYELKMATMTYSSTRAEWKLYVDFKRDDPKSTAEWVFTGVSFGYGGEGPRGLMELAEIFGIKLDPKKVFEHGVFPESGGLSLKRFI